MIKKNWVNIFSSTNKIQVEIIKNLLQENNINTVIINKQDSSYLMFGEIHLYIHINNLSFAKELINNDRK